MTKLIFTSDWHFRPGRYPRRDIPASDMQIFLLLQLEEEEADAVIVAGDFFESWHVPIWYLNWLASEVLTSHKVKIYSIFGNHDLPSGNIIEYDRTALYGLHLMQGVLPEKRIMQFDNYRIGFADFGTENRLKDESLDFLVMHRMVFADKIPHWAVGAVTAQQLLEEFPRAKNIVVGDVHIPFIYSEKKRDIVSEFNVSLDGRHVINCGGVFREHESEQKFIYVLEGRTLKAKPLKERHGFTSRVVVADDTSVELDFSVIEELKKAEMKSLNFWSVFQKIGDKILYEYARKLTDEVENER